MGDSTDAINSSSHKSATRAGTGATASGSVTLSLRRAVGLLRLLSTHTQIGWRLTDLTEHSALDRATVHRLLTSLCD